MASSKILILGASGYIGGSVLSQLQRSPDSKIKSATFSVLVRSQDQAALLQRHGVTPIVFRSLDDTATLKQIASEHDVVINAAISFNTGAAQALILGLSERKLSGRDVTYLHTSGTSSLADHPLTNTYRETRIFSDTENIYEYELSREAQQAYDQRSTDIAVVKAGIAAQVKTYIIMPPTIYGEGIGLFNRSSVQEPLIIKMALKLGQTPVLGPGNENMDHVHIQDLAELYELILSQLLQGEQLPYGEQGIYFSDGGQHTWRELSEGVAKAGVELGVLKAQELKELALQEFMQLCSSTSTIVPPNENQVELSFASRARTVADRARQLGWAPKYGDREWKEHFVEEFKAVMHRAG